MKSGDGVMGCQPTLPGRQGARGEVRGEAGGGGGGGGRHHGALGPWGGEVRWGEVTEVIWGEVMWVR